MAVNKVALNICGIQLGLSTEESPAYMEKLGKKVQEAMESFLKAVPAGGRELAAVATALSFCDQAEKLESGSRHLEKLQGEKMALEEEIISLKNSNDKAEKALARETELLRRELTGLRAKLEEQELKADKPIEKTEASEADKPAPLKKPLRNPMRVEEEFEQQGFVSFFEKL